MNQIQPQVSDAIKSWSSYARFSSVEIHMFQNFCGLWTLAPFVKQCSRDLPNLETREKVFVQVAGFCAKFNQELQKKVKSYQDRADADSTSKLDKVAFVNMKKLFSSHLPDFEFLLPKIDACRKVVFGHFKVLKESDEKSINREEILKEGTEMHDQLTKLRVAVGNLLIATDEKIEALSKRGEAIGPSFKANPQIFLQGARMFSLKDTEISGKSVEEAVQIIESIKQEQSVQKALQPYYLLCMNAIRALAKMEKGIGKIVAAIPVQQNGAPGGPSID